MSLNWDVTDIAGKDEVCWIEVDGKRQLNPVTEAMIFTCMAVGIGTITEKGAPEWFARAYSWERAYGPMMRDSDGTPRPITWTDVRAHVGLRTNVFPAETDAVFARKLMRGLRDSARLIIQNAERAERDA